MLKQQLATLFILIKIVTSRNFWCLRMNRINYYPKSTRGDDNNKHVLTLTPAGAGVRVRKCLGLLLPTLPRQILPVDNNDVASLRFTAVCATSCSD